MVQSGSDLAPRRNFLVNMIGKKSTKSVHHFLSVAFLFFRSRGYTADQITVDHIDRSAENVLEVGNLDRWNKRNFHICLRDCKFIGCIRYYAKLFVLRLMSQTEDVWALWKPFISPVFNLQSLRGHFYQWQQRSNYLVLLSWRLQSHQNVRNRVLQAPLKLDIPWLTCNGTNSQIGPTFNF